jgi:hypothetical protein
MSKRLIRAIPLLAAIAAAPAFAHDHDGSKRLMRQMAMGDGDPQGLIAVPHSATVRSEQERMAALEDRNARAEHEDTHHGATKRHHKED